ncbi:uncharacterized protein LOC110692622 [Chenopodium quinoa]|uniref:Uncharacterized protein n=1 Tax=Chenopodium quinoa TaxID=63459 RepID=A0A803N9X7_CHEQI|nr:uncharacterized protein LOC110692622 [Chenopodium quinoa]XP_021725342.1 uncharacterized protein LOC110692622 [Chenopodium quinoa]XP_021725343.1 uncharacterized protein LOC110692622 [Chenopodium quinoa]
MGCGSSRFDNEERVRICKERRRTLKQLLGYRKEFASAILAYLKALKDTGITLRQYTELESLEFESQVRSSPPLTLPPAPPRPPPIDSPDSKKLEDNQNGKKAQEEITEVGEGSDCPPPLSLRLWDPCDLLESSLGQDKVESVLVEDMDEENWAEAKTQFDEDDQVHVTSDKTSDALRANSPNVDDNSSLVTGKMNHMVDRPMVVWRKRKTLSGIVKELDDYFLKASAGGKEIAVLVDMSTSNISLHHDLKGKKGKENNSARLSSLPLNLSARSLQVAKDDLEPSTPTEVTEPCKPGAHCITLEKIYAEEQTLYAAVREEEMVKVEHKRKSLSLRKLEDDNGELDKIEKTRSAVENLQSDIVRLQESVKRTSASILTIIDKELHPQLIALLTGLIQMWKTMNECHQVQFQISQQVLLLISHNTEPITENHREAAMQLEGGVSFWYNSFCRLTKSQRDYIESLCKWIQLTDCAIDGENQNCCPSEVRALCQNWLLALDRLPAQVVSEAIKSFLKVIRSIRLQQQEEFNLKKKVDKLERKWLKELESLSEIEKKLQVSNRFADMESGLSLKHPLSVKRAKIGDLQKMHENEKARYLSSIQISRAMTLSKLQKSLPHVFEKLTEFSNACKQFFETVLNHADQVYNADG